MSDDTKARPGIDPDEPLTDKTFEDIPPEEVIKSRDKFEKGEVELEQIASWVDAWLDRHHGGDLAALIRIAFPAETEQEHMQRVINATNGLVKDLIQEHLQPSLAGTACDLKQLSSRQGTALMDSLRIQVGYAMTMGMGALMRGLHEAGTLKEEHR